MYITVSDVVFNGIIKKDGLLRDDGDLAAQRLQCDVANVMTVDQDTAFGYVVKTGYQIYKRRFSAAAHADKRDNFTGFDGEINVFQYGRCFITEMSHFPY